MILSREIAFYQKKGSAQINSFVINVPIEKLIDILNIDIEDDSNLYKIYEINKNQYVKLKELIPQLLKVDFRKVAVYYECRQVG